MCVSIFMFFFILFCFLQCRERGKKPYCCKDYNLDWDLNVSISAWCIYEPLQTLSVLLTTACAQIHIRGCYFPRGPSSDCCCCIEHGQQWPVFEKGGVGAAWLLLSPCPSTDCTLHIVCWLAIIPSLSSFFFIPMRWRLPATGEQCCFCDGLSRLRKSVPSFPTVPTVRQHVYLCWYSCVCVCVCVCSQAGFV